MQIDARGLWSRLRAEPEEKAVLTVVFEPQDDGLVLRCGSLLIGPSPAVASGWPAWRLAEGRSPTPSETALAAPAEFVADVGPVTVGRATIELEEALAWLQAALQDGTCPAIRCLPAASASLTAAKAPIRVSTESETAAGAMAAWLARPIAGYHFKRTDEPAQISPGNQWVVNGKTHFSPALDLLGMSWFEHGTSPAPSGLLVGRFERRAWLAGQHLHPESDLYEVRIGLEPDRMDVADLELEVEDRVDGELVLSERLRLEDTDLPESDDLLRPPPGQERRASRSVLQIMLPTLGRQVRRVVRLHTRDGELLDEWPAFNIVESIGLTMTVDGTRRPITWIGGKRTGVDLVERLGSVERVRKQYENLRRQGLSRRLFDDPALGWRTLRRMLERTPGEVLVIDPWLRDWGLLSGLGGIPPRVLIGANVPGPPAEFEGKVARWRRKSAVPFHDRFFLWDGGGVSVGTSTGSPAARLFRIARIAAAESSELHERVAVWWSDPDFERL
jgi:hypothetical protein